MELQPYKEMKCKRSTEIDTDNKVQKQLMLKKPPNYLHHLGFHHPYYLQSACASSTTQTKKLNGISNRMQSHPALYVINQNSNISFASSSTCGTISSHAPTQQSNTTTSNISTTRLTSSTKTAYENDADISTDSRISKTQTNNVCNIKKVKLEPVLSQFHQLERLEFANTYFIWGLEHWKHVVFHDERKFNLDGPDGFSNYFHDLRNCEHTLSRRPRGNSIFVYVLITFGGPIHIEISLCKSKPENTIKILLRNRANIIAKLDGKTNFFVQDHNWSGNILPASQEMLTSQGIKTQKWPCIAHDLNIMENIWGWIIREVYDSGRKFSRKDDLICRIREAWERIPEDFLINLYATLPDRISELIFTQGVYTNC